MAGSNPTGSPAYGWKGCSAEAEAGISNDSPVARRSLEEEIDALGLRPEDAESLRAMARRARARLGLTPLGGVRVSGARNRQPDRVPMAGVPRSFNAGRMLVIVTMFAVLFSLLGATEAPTPVYPLVGSFCAAVVLGQMILFRGRQPRAASCIVGGFMMPLLALITVAVVRGPRLFDDFRGDPFGMLSSSFCTAFACSLVGVVAGYVVGTFCAGVFLIVDRQWNAGLIVSEEPIDAEIVTENETEADSTGGDDPWSRA